jgi:TPR repeat protein/secreted trypsin-like serine protease
MRGWLAMGLGVLLGLAGLGAPAHATPMLADGPIPRIYPERGSERADPDKPADIRAEEIANADASEADCNAGIWAACTFLGEAYHRGEGRPQNRPVAELLYRRACDAADGLGCFQLGELLRATKEDIDVQIGAALYARACRLGVLEGCDAEADALERSDPVAAEALRRATCERGGRDACRALAGLLMARDRSRAEQDEGRALIDRQCRAGDAAACGAAAEHWRLLIAPDARARMAEYQERGCSAGDAWLCIARAEAALVMGKGAAERSTALTFFDRACAINTSQCAYAAQLRNEPGLRARCDGGDRVACTALGQSLAETGSPLEDKPRALALLGAACEAGDSAVCFAAAELVYDAARETGTPDPVQLDAYLDRACAAGERNACELLADALADGVTLPQDIARAAALYAQQCEEERITACAFLEEQASNDPAAPLMLARANFGPELTPDEEAEEARLEREADERERIADRLRSCTTTTVVFEGVSYTDTICNSVTRVIGMGFSVRRGATPWQALLWRPPLLGRQELTPGERVLCGGSVIREGWILTAAHCITDKHMGGVSITTGGHVIRLGLTNALGDEGFSYPIIATYRHPDYDPDILTFDIALVQYDPKRGRRGSNALAPARIRVDPLPLGQRRIEAIPRASTYGWGLTAVDNGVIPDQLRGARVKLRDLAACTEATKYKDDKRRDSVICADQLQGAEGGQACDGDSGGPLITYSDADKVPTLIGVVSGGAKCGTLGKPSRYIRVAHPRVQKWLNDILNPVRSR